MDDKYNFEWYRFQEEGVLNVIYALGMHHELAVTHNTLRAYFLNRKLKVEMPDSMYDLKEWIAKHPSHTASIWDIDNLKEVIKYNVRDKIDRDVLLFKAAEVGSFIYNVKNEHRGNPYLQLGVFTRHSTR